MKRLFFLMIFCFFSLAVAQKKKTTKLKPAEKITSEMALMSDNPQVIAAFMKANPDDPNIPALRSKLLQMVVPANDKAAKPKVETLTAKKLSKEVNKEGNESGANEKSKQAARILNHLFDNNPNKREACVQITNKSKCNIIVKFDGKNKFYNLDVPANNKRYILIDKGNYQLTTSVCDAKYAQQKSINKDIAITLGNR